MGKFRRHKKSQIFTFRQRGSRLLDRLHISRQQFEESMKLLRNYPHPINVIVGDMEEVDDEEWKSLLESQRKIDEKFKK
tara:strand:+ start:830 stop:1066 length:237 start_codon:yes stop_codon:yes gene_type:complete